MGNFRRKFGRRKESGRKVTGKEPREERREGKERKERKEERRRKKKKDKEKGKVLVRRGSALIKPAIVRFMPT